MFNFSIICISKCYFQISFTNFQIEKWKLKNQQLAGYYSIKKLNWQILHTKKIRLLMCSLFNFIRLLHVLPLLSLESLIHLYQFCTSILSIFHNYMSLQYVENQAIIKCSELISTLLFKKKKKDSSTFWAAF